VYYYLGIDWGTHGEHHWELRENIMRTPKSKRNPPPSPPNTLQFDKCRKS